MADNTPKRPAPRAGNNNSKSNTIRSVLFTFVLLCIAMLFIANLSGTGAKKTEVPISDVIKRANDPEGNIAKITVTSG